MNYLKTHDKFTVEEDITDMTEQVAYRYKNGDFMASVPHAIFRYRRENVGDHGHWTPLDTTGKGYYSYISKEYLDNLALVVLYSDGDEHLISGIGSDVDYIFTKTRNIYLSKSRTDKLRLWVKPAKVEREEEEEEQQ